MLRLAYSSETGWPHQRAVDHWRDERLPWTDAHGCSCYHALLMALGTDKTKIWSLCEVFQCEPGTVPFSIDFHIIMFLWAGDGGIEFSVWTHDVCVVLRTMYQQLTVPLSEDMQLGLLHQRLILPCSSAVSRNKHEEMWARLLHTTRFHAGNANDTDFMWNNDGWHDCLMIPSRLLTNMEFHCNLFKLYRTLHAWEPVVRITVMRLSNRGRLEPSTSRQARTLPLVFPSVICNRVTLLFFFLKCRKNFACDSIIKLAPRLLNCCWLSAYKCGCL